jgi:hypothetical protein
MKKILLLLALAYLGLVQVSYATSFVATISPTLFNSSLQTTMTLEIYNLNDTYNITQVSLTLPENFVLKYCDACSGDGLNWLRIITPGNKESFTFGIEANVNGTYNFTATTLDENASSVTNYTNNFDVNDTKPPTCSSIFPGSANITYSPNTNYYFNVTCEDNIKLSKVIFFFGSNQTVFDAESRTYTATVILSDLKAGLYTYYWSANDTNGNYMQTQEFKLNVTPAPNPFNVYLNSNLNQNISIRNGSSLNVTVRDWRGDLTIYQTGPENNTYTSSDNIIILSNIGLYNYTFLATGNENYTYNTTKYFVLLTPNFTTSTSIPSTPTSSATFTIEFLSDPNLGSMLIEGTWSGTLQRMSNSSAVRYTYSISLTPGTYQWRLHANVSNVIIPLTTFSSFSIGKATPSVVLTASPSWTVEEGTQTTVTCLSPSTAKLYRSGTLVSNPDVQRLAIGNYTYVCESEESQNYTSGTASAVLRVVKRSYADLAFVEKPSLVIVQQNSSNSTVVSVKNTGNLNQTINLTVENVSISWSTNATNVRLAPNEIATFLVTFTAGSQAAGIYQSAFKAYSPNKTIATNFNLSIELSEEAKLSINSTIQSYKASLLEIEAEINRTKESGADVSSIESTFNTFKALVQQAESYAQEGNYAAASQILGSIAPVLEAIKNDLARFKGGQPNYLLYVIIGVSGAIIGFLVYLFWPTEEMPKQKAKERKQALIKAVKQIFAKKTNNN